MITPDTIRQIIGCFRRGHWVNGRVVFPLFCCGSLLWFATGLEAAEKISASIWDLNTGKRIQTFVGHNRPVTAVAFSPDGSNILTGSVTSELRLWDAKTGKQIQTFQADGQTKALAFSPAGNRLLICQSPLVICDVKTGAITQTLETNCAFEAAIFTADGQRVLASGQWWEYWKGGEGFHCGVKEWETASGKLLRTLWEIKWSGYDYVTLAADGKTRTWWNSETGAPDPEQKRLGSPMYGSDDGYYHNVAISPDGSKVFTWSVEMNRARLWDAESGKLIWFSQEFGGYRGQVAFSSDGSQFLIGNAAGGAKLWDAKTGSAIRIFGEQKFEKYSPESYVAFSPNGKIILTWGRDHKTRLWNCETGEKIRSLPVPVMRCVAFSPDGTKIAVGEDGEFRGI